MSDQAENEEMQQGPDSDPDDAARLAAIDIGSNSIRLVVAEFRAGGEYRVLDDEREATRLARTLDSTGLLDEQSINDSLAALRRLRKIAAGFDVTQVRTIATCAVREAENGGEFLWRAREEAGVDIEVITPEQEAQLAFRSVRRAMDIVDKNVVIADIGGGSTEIVFASGDFIQEIISTTLGAVRLTEQFGIPHRLFDEDFDGMVSKVDRQLRRKLKKPPFAPQMIIGSGGTFTTLASMLAAARGQGDQPQWGYRASRADVRHLLDKLQKMALKQRRGVTGLSSDRADIIVAGLVIVDRLMKRLNVNVLSVHQGGVRDGLLLEMSEELHLAPAREIDREASVERLASSCGVDMQHSLHVAHLAGRIYSQLAEPCGLDLNDAGLLEAAAKLQDAGYLISYSSHHKHSYQLIINSRLPGFRRDELEIIANVARYHRGARPKKKHVNFRRLRREDQQRVRQLSAILRLAGGLDRSHSQHVIDVIAQVNDGHTKISVEANGDPEVDLWAARRRAGMFEKVFSTEVSVSLMQAAKPPS